ncbi:type II toxin-antitoxin system death-on-curing family toxin [Candidatus Amesbacteria bacterium]|nr:type II toxin-antitoxin system death-on-curing family toxin [Candidatus Amesbacteria bacterium]
MNWQTVDIEEAILIHEIIIKRAGTTAGVRDFALLHSALERPKATYAGKDLYPDIFSKAASLLQSICLNHPFTDGNKRTAWAVTHKFLWDNSYLLKSKSIEAADFMVYVDNLKPDIRQISAWLKSHCIQIVF